jgi:hypothetical protein
MGPKSKQARHLLEARTRAVVVKTDSLLVTTNAKQFVFGVLVAGVSYSQAKMLCLQWGKLPITQDEFYTAQRSILPVILEFTQEVVKANAAQITAPACLGVDGSWNHRRNATEHIVEFVECRSGKVVDFEVVSRSTGFSPGNYNGSANGMETE